MEEKKWDSYINEILGYVKFKYDHKEIRRELTEHMTDLKEDLMLDGMDEEAAEYMAIAHMGEASEIGQELDKEHHALLGWLWRITRIIVVILIILNFNTIQWFFTGFIGNHFDKYEPQSMSEEVWRMELDREYRVYDYTLLIEDVYFYEDNTMTVVYRTKYNPFDKTIDWGATMRVDIFDENGEYACKSGSGYKNGGYNGIGWTTKKEVLPNAKTLNLQFGDLLVTIDLETGEVTDNAET